MSSFNVTRRTFVLGAASILALGACGLKPSLAPSSAAADLYGRLTVKEPDSRDQYVFVRQIEDRVGANPGADLELEYTFDIGRTSQGITSDQSTSRYLLSGQTTYVLRSKSSGAAVAQGAVTAISSYSATGSTVATRAARNDAYERLMVQMADLVLSRLTAEAPRLP